MQNTLRELILYIEGYFLLYFLLGNIFNGQLKETFKKLILLDLSIRLI